MSSPLYNPVMSILLFSGKLNGQDIHIRATIDGSTGDLVIAGHDIGPLCVEFVGKDEYEYWLRIKSEYKERVIEHLEQDLEENCQMSEADAREENARDRYLLALIFITHAHDPHCFESFRDWCKGKEIPTHFANY